MSNLRPYHLIYYLNDRKNPYIKRLPSSLRLSDVKIDELKNFIGGDFVFFEEDHLFTSSLPVPGKKEIECDAQLQKYVQKKVIHLVSRSQNQKSETNQFPLYVETREFYNGNSAIPLKEAERDNLKNSETTSLKDLNAKMTGLLEDTNTLKADNAALKEDNATLKADNAVLKATSVASKADDEGIKGTMSRHSEFEPNREKMLSQVGELRAKTATVRTQVKRAAEGVSKVPILHLHTEILRELEGLKKLEDLSVPTYNYMNYAEMSRKPILTKILGDMHQLKSFMEEEESQTLKISEGTCLEDLLTKMAQLLEEIDTYLKADISMALKADVAVLKADNAALKAHNAEVNAVNAALKADNAALKADDTALKADNAALKTNIEVIEKTKERLKKLEWMLKPASALHKDVTRETQKEPGEVELE